MIPLTESITCIDLLKVLPAQPSIPDVFELFVVQHYPDYYAIIKEPIDLRTIAQRIQVFTQGKMCCFEFYTFVSMVRSD